MCLAGSVCRRYMASIRASESVPSYGSPLSLQHDGPVTKPWSRALDHLTLRHFCSERKHVSSTGLATLDKHTAAALDQTLVTAIGGDPTTADKLASKSPRSPRTQYDFVLSRPL